MSSQLTKAQVRAILQADTDAALADFFGVTRSAVAQWGEHAPIPELRQLQLERKRPELFASVPMHVSDQDHGPHRRSAAEGESAAKATPPAAPLSEAA